MPFTPAAGERAMRVHEVILRALSGELTWLQAADILAYEVAKRIRDIEPKSDGSNSDKDGTALRKVRRPRRFDSFSFR